MLYLSLWMDPPPFLYSLLLFISWGWWGTYDYLLVSLVWVKPNLIILDKEYASLETVAMALELVPTSKRLLDSGNPQGNSKLPRSRATPGKYSPRLIHTWSAWAFLTCDQWNGRTIGLGLKNILGVCPCQGPRPSGPEAVYRTIMNLSLIHDLKKLLIYNESVINTWPKKSY